MTVDREAWLPAVVPSVAEWLEDTAHVLAVRYDYLDPDAEEYPAAVLAELAELAKAGPCEDCPGWPNPDTLAQHFVTRKLQEWERSLPTWTCDCGAVYKPVTERGALGYWQARPDGLLGDRVGYVKTNAKGQVKHSGACACGRRFADTVARQADPQQTLF